MPPSASVNPTKGLLSLIVVYLVWGSTYLFIRLTVREGSGFPPFAMAASRTLCASVILFVITVGLRHRLRLTASDLKVLVLSGLLLWIGGNGLVVWAERHADSGYAALVIGSTPMWPIIMEAVLERRLPSFLMVVSLLVGFSGLAVLVSPVLKEGLKADVTSTAALLGAAIAWSAGSLLMQRRPPETPTILTSAYQHLFGGLGLTAVMLITGEPWPQPTPLAWMGWTYLVVAGSLISFTAYIIAVKNLPISLVMTYAYVNPVIAILLGRLILGEQITGATVLGMILIFLGVSGVFWKRFGLGNR